MNSTDTLPRVEALRKILALPEGTVITLPGMGETPTTEADIVGQLADQHPYEFATASRRWEWTREEILAWFQPVAILAEDGSGPAYGVGFSEDAARVDAIAWGFDCNDGDAVAITHDSFLRIIDGDPDAVEKVSENIRCGCGAWTGERCAWAGPRSEMVVIEWMPLHLRASHASAGNRGTYPANGAVRVLAHRDCAAGLLESDEDWAKIVS